MPDTQPERQNLRQLIRQRRKSLSQAEQQAAAQQLVERFQEHPGILAARRIALYLANDGELDPLPAIHWLWARQKEVYLPVLHPFTPGHLLFLRYTATTPMTRNRYGIAEPELDVQQVLPHSMLDIICTPLVAFDEAGNRLGMGAATTIAPSPAGTSTSSAQDPWGSPTTASRWMPSPGAVGRAAPPDHHPQPQLALCLIRRGRPFGSINRQTIYILGIFAPEREHHGRSGGMLGYNAPAFSIRIHHDSR